MQLHKIAVVALTTFSASGFASNEALISLQVSKSAYETDSSSGGDQISLNGNILLESRDGSFHRAELHSSIDATSSPGKGDDSLLNFEYNIGKFWYPKASANDYSIWSGLGHWEFKDSVGTGVAFDRSASVLYIPLGFEGGNPISYPNIYFIYGADIKGVIDSTIKIGNNKDSDISGFGYSAWLGVDYHLDSGNAFEFRLSYENIDLDSSDYEYKSSQLTMGFRF